jgi:hypothetical protein
MEQRDLDALDVIPHQQVGVMIWTGAEIPDWYKSQTKGIQK